MLKDKGRKDDLPADAAELCVYWSDNTWQDDKLGKHNHLRNETIQLFWHLMYADQLYLRQLSWHPIMFRQHVRKHAHGNVGNRTIYRQ